VLDAGSSPKEIALTLLGRSGGRSSLPDALSDEAYADWRIEILGLMLAET
jgi:hypothetical protein